MFGDLHDLAEIPSDATQWDGVGALETVREHRPQSYWTLWGASQFTEMRGGNRTATQPKKPRSCKQELTFPHCRGAGTDGKDWGVEVSAEGLCCFGCFTWLMGATVSPLHPRSCHIPLWCICFPSPSRQKVLWQLEMTVMINHA